MLASVPSKGGTAVIVAAPDVGAAAKPKKGETEAQNAQLHAAFLSREWRLPLPR